MTIQSILLGIIAPILYGSLFHLWRGGSVWRLGLYIILAEIGFWLGHVAAQQMEWTFLKVGQLQMGIGTVSGLLLMVIGHWLSIKEVEPEAKRKKNVSRGGRI